MVEHSGGQSGDATGHKKLGLSGKILIGLATGIGCGLFFGEYCAPLKVVGDAFVGLLQMTVLPYITLSLVLNIGRLTPSRARQTFRIGGVVLLVLWAIAVITIAVTPLALPRVDAGSFFSTDLIKDPEPFDFIGLYIPVNPFHSLANAVVPAVVVFSIFLGVALMGVERKENLLEILDTGCRALVRANSFVMRLTPVGMLAIAASAAGTMRLEEVERLQAYFLVYIVVAVGLTFWVLPTLVASLTPFGYREVMRASRDAVVTAFATGKTFVVLPLLIDGAARLLQRLDIDKEEAEGEAGLLVPLAYPFPTIGKLLALLFIPFAAWFVGVALSPGQMALLLSTGLLSLFGSPVAAIPYLLDLFRLPADLFNLFLVSGAVGARLSDSVGAMHLMAFTLLVGAALAGALRVRQRRMLTAAAVGLILLGVSVIGIRGYLGAKVTPAGPSVVDSMEIRTQVVPHVVVTEAGPNPVPLLEGESRIDRIRRRGIVRIGTHPDELPFSYLNRRGDLVGFDVEMAHRIAYEMGVEIEFVPLEFDRIENELDADYYDIAMAGIVGSYQYLHRVLPADSGIELTSAIVVPDHRRKQFVDRAAIRSLGPIRLGMVGEPRLPLRLMQRFPDVEIVQLGSHQEYFEERSEELDGIAVVAETGAAWTLRHPGFAVVIPADLEIRSPLIYPVAADSVNLAVFVNRWFKLARDDGTTREIYDYWILGRGVVDRGKRWSVIRDVLHWVD
jgi:Na+/H+-dicarboxylate symporter